MHASLHPFHPYSCGNIIAGLSNWYCPWVSQSVFHPCMVVYCTLFCEFWYLHVYTSYNILQSRYVCMYVVFRLTEIQATQLYAHKRCPPYWIERRWQTYIFLLEVQTTHAYATPPHWWEWSHIYVKVGKCLQLPVSKVKHLFDLKLLLKVYCTTVTQVALASTGKRIFAHMGTVYIYADLHIRTKRIAFMTHIHGFQYTTSLIHIYTVQKGRSV